jgi:hypothetical protein
MSFDGYYDARTAVEPGFLPETGSLIATGELPPEQQGLGTEFAKGAATGTRRFVQSVATTAGELGLEPAAEFARELEVGEQFQQQLKPAPGALNRAVHTMGTFVEQVPTIAAAIATGTAGAKVGGLALKGATTLSQLQRGVKAVEAGRRMGSWIGMGTGVFARSFGHNVQEMEARGMKRDEAVLVALAKVGAETALESIPLESMFGSAMNKAALKSVKGLSEAAEAAGGFGNKALTVLGTGIRLPASYAKRVAANVGIELITENLQEGSGELINYLATGEHDFSFDTLRETSYQTFFSMLPLAALGSMFSGGRSDVRRNENARNVVEPVTEETIQAAHATPDLAEAQPQEQAAVIAQRQEQFERTASVFESVMNERFGEQDARAISEIFRTVSLNLAAMDPDLLPVDIFNEVRVAFETGQVDQEAWDAANEMDNPEEAHREKMRLVLEASKAPVIAITDRVLASEMRQDNEKRTQEYFGDQTPEKLAARVKLNIPPQQPVTRMMASEAMDKETYALVYALGRVSGIKSGKKAYTAVARGIYEGADGRRRLVTPGDVVFVEEVEVAAPAAAETAEAPETPQQQAVDPVLLEEQIRAQALDRAGPETQEAARTYYDARRTTAAEGQLTQGELDRVAWERAMATLSEQDRADIQSIIEEAGVLATGSDVAAAFRERYSKRQVTEETTIGRTEADRPLTIKDFDALAGDVQKRRPQRAEKPTIPGDEPVARTAESLEALAQRTGIPRTIVAALSRDVQEQMLNDEEYAQEVSTELLPRIEMQNAMAQRAMETEALRQEAEEVNAFAREILERRIAEQAGVRFAETRSAKAPTTPAAFYDQATKAMHFFQNATSVEVIHEMFHMMLDTGLMPSPMLADLTKFYAGDDGEWTVEADEAAVDGFLRYLRTRELPEGAGAGISEAFAHIRDVMASSGASLTGQFNDEALAVFDAWFDFTPSEDNRAAADALTERMVQLAEIEGGETYRFQSRKLDKSLDI